MKRIYDFSRNPAQRNYTVADLKALKGSGKTLTMCNPADRDQIIACVEAGIDCGATCSRDALCRRRRYGRRGTDRG